MIVCFVDIAHDGTGRIIEDSGAILVSVIFLVLLRAVQPASFGTRRQDLVGDRVADMLW